MKIQIYGCPIPKFVGNITILNIWDGLGFEILKLDNEVLDTLIAFGSKKNNQLEILIQLPYEYTDKFRK